MVLSDDNLANLLTRWPRGSLATVSANATPHCVPIVFCLHDGVIYSPVDGKRKSQRRLQRFANLDANPRASLLLDQYSEDWQQLWWVRIDGPADWYEPAAPASKSIGRLLLEKYPQYQNPTLMFDDRAFLRLRPTNVTAWAQSGSVATIEAAIAFP